MAAPCLSGPSDRLAALGESLLSGSSLDDGLLCELADLIQDQDLTAARLARRARAASPGAAPPPPPAAAAAPQQPAGLAARPMKLASRLILITADEHRCTPSVAQVLLGGTVRIAVASGPPQAFEIANSTTGDCDETPRIPAGQHYDWQPSAPGTHTISSNVYPGCKATVVVRPTDSRAVAAPATAGASLRSSCGDSSLSSASDGSMSAVDESIRFPLRMSSAAQTDPITSASRFAATDSHLPPIARPLHAACTPASVLPGITSAAAAAVRGGSAGAAAGLFHSPEELDVFDQTGLRRRAATRPGSAGSTASEPGGRAAAASNASSQGSPRAASAAASGPIYRPGRSMNMGSLRSMSPVSTHSSEETMPLLDIRMNNRVQQHRSSVFPTSGSRGALVSPTSVASCGDTTHKCPRCRKEYLSTINQRRCLAVHLGHKAGTPSGKGAKPSGSMPDRTQLVQFWDGLPLAQKQAVVSLKSEAGSEWGESVLRNMEIRLLQREGPHAHTAEQRTMLAAGRTLFEVLVRGKGLESLSGEALATLLSKASESTFLFDRALPARDESTTGFNVEAGLSVLISRRLVDALLSHRQEQADKAQKELEALEEAQKGEKGKLQQVQQAERGKKKDKKVKPKLKPKQPGKGLAKAGSDSLSRGDSTASSLASAELESSLPGAAAVEDSARGTAGTAAAAAAAAAQPAPAASKPRSSSVTPAKPPTAGGGGRAAPESDAELTPPSAHTRYPAAEADAAPARQATPVTYVNALYRADGEDGSGSWQPAVKGSGRGQQAAAGGSRPAAAGSGQRPALRPLPFAERQQQQQQGSRPAVAPEAARGPRPAGAAAPVRPAAPAAAPTAPTADAFPALPSKAAGKGEASAAAPACPPATGISYASAAARPKQQQQQQQQAASAWQAESGAQTPAPDSTAQPQPDSAAAPAEERAATARAAAGPKLPPPLPVMPAAGAAASSGSGGAAHADAPAAAVIAEAPVPAQSTAAAPAAEQAAERAASPRCAPELVAPEPQPAAPVQQLLAMGAAGTEEGLLPGGAAERAQAGQQVLELGGARSITPPLDGTGGHHAPLVGPGPGLQDGSFPPMPPPYGFPPPPVGYYYPMPPVVLPVQFGDVDMGQIMEEQQQGQQHQAPHFFPPPAYPGALPPFAGAMPPFPPSALGVPAPHPMQQPHLQQPFPAPGLPQPAVAPAASAPVAPAAEAAVQQQEEDQEGQPAQVIAAAAEAAAAEAAAAEAAAGMPTPEADSQEQQQPVSAAAEAAVEAAPVAGAPGTAAQSMQLAGMLRAAEAAWRRPAFDPAAAARELSSRWQAALAAQPEPARQAGGNAPQQHQHGGMPQAMPRSSSASGGSWRSGSPSGSERRGSGGHPGGAGPQQRGGRGVASVAGRSEWRPAVKEQRPPPEPQQPGQEPQAGGQAPGAAPANGSAQRLPLSFAAVAGSGPKASGEQGKAVRAWSSDEGGEGKWKIQARPAL